MRPTTLPLVDRHHGAALRRRAHARDGAALRPVPGAAQHAARSGFDAQGAGRPAVGREVGAAVPHHARHRADRALDDAARLRGPLHEEPAQHQPRGPRPQGRQRRHVRHLAGAQRLQVGAIAAAVRASRGRARGAAGRHGCHDGTGTAASPAATGAATCRSRASSPAPTSTATRASTRSAPATSAPWACHSSPVASSRRADVARSPKVAIVNEAFAKKFNLGRDAVGKRIGSGAHRRGPGYRDRRPRAEREVQRSQARDPAALLPPVPRRTTKSDR